MYVCCSSRYLWKMSLFKADNMQQGVVSKNKVRIVKMLVCIATVFVLLWLPYFVLFTIAVSTPCLKHHSFIHSFIHS
jgi:hypothetical protein